jgi:hypothetical protein
MIDLPRDQTVLDEEQIKYMDTHNVLFVRQ